ncbi:type I polyketide synthase [Nocardia asiatica]|uniref:type I polyketide synthase n=1 Tax=Nocardia asiatica TaxID=209252 RepID=UPI0024544CCE|nr:type I polyketide synthase [Nocardia asiatica]
MLTRALRRIQELEARPQREPIAIVGIGCRFPGGAENPQQYWELLSSGRDAIVEAPENRWTVTDSAPRRARRRAGLLAGPIDAMDAEFLGIAPREAASMDPQQRLVLEVAWEAMEDAAVVPDGPVAARTGVFLGVSWQEYQRTITPEWVNSVDAHTLTGTMSSIVAGRVSYVLGLRGPAVAIDTACSSSLVAVHQACRSLRTGECDVALAGGVNLLQSELTSEALARMGALSPDGHCRPFDARANGYVRGEGAGVVVLKTLSRAIADGDAIRALIRGSSVNHDGRSMGLTAPNPTAQRELLRAALTDGGCDAGLIGYVETHGTGTPLGDPIEIEALSQVLGAPRADGSVCLLGSVKSQIGHLEAAAGVAGLIKVVLQLEHERIPRQYEFATLNPKIALDGTALEVPTRDVAWPRTERPRLAGVSSFGFAGTNAHVVLEQAPEPAARAESEQPALLVLSARSASALDALAQRYAEHLHRGEVPVADVAATAASGRTHFAHRRAVVARTAEEAARALATSVARATGPASGEPRVAMLFTGQGAQYAGMGAALDRRYPAFRAALDRCDELLGPLPGGLRLRSVLFDANEELLARTEYAQPAMFAIEWACAELWSTFGIRPRVVLGHSLGELVAATVAGALDLPAGLRLAAERGRLMQAVAQEGAMAAVFAAPAQFEGLLAELAASLAVAAVNGPGQFVVSGAADAVGRVVRAAEERAIRTVRLPGTTAFHSPLLDSMLDDFRTRVAELVPAPRVTAIPLVSNVTGARIDAPMDAAYWRAHARGTVRFAEGIRSVAEFGVDAYLEVGPHPVLLEFGRRTDPDALWAPSMRRASVDDEVLLSAVGDLYCAGAAIDWDAVVPPEARRRNGLPTYPFERVRITMPSSDSGYLAEHRFRDRAVVPAAELALRALRAAGAADDELIDFVAARPVPLEELSEPLVSRREDRAEVRFQVDDGTVTAVSAVVRAASNRPRDSGSSSTARLRPSTEWDADDFYRRCAEAGLTFGPRFRWITRLRLGADSVLAELTRPAELAGEPDAWLSCLLDAAVQTGLALATRDNPAAQLPVGIGRLRLSGEQTGGRAWALAERTGRTIRITVFNTADAVIGDFEDVWFAESGTAEQSQDRDRMSRLTHRPTWAPAVAVPRGQRLDAASVIGVGRQADRLAAALRAGGTDAVAVERTTDPAVWPGDGRTVIYLADIEADDSADAARTETELALGVVRAMARTVTDGPLYLVTVGATAALPGEPVRPAAATLCGLGAVVRSELPELRCRLIDLPVGAHCDDHRLVSELSTDTDEYVVALRGRHRYTMRLQPSDDAEMPPRLDRAAAYLITGGRGALGATAARILAEAGAGTVVLAGRSAPAPGDEREMARIAAVGARVETAVVDVADRNALSRLLARFGDHFPRLAGVVHCAGVLDDALLIEQTSERVERVFAGKVAGAWHLHELTADRSLDLFVLFSSVSAVVGTAGQGNYAAANAYLDALAHLRSAQGLPAVSIAWGPWAGTGMAGGLSDAARRAWARHGVAELTVEDGARALRSLVAAEGVVAVFPAVTAEPEPISEVDEQDVHDPRDSAELLEVVRAHAMTALGRTTAVADRTPLRELGLDSMMAVDLRNALSAELGVRLPATLLFDHPTVAAVSEEIARLGAKSTRDSAAPRRAARERAEQRPITRTVEQLTPAVYPAEFPVTPTTPDVTQLTRTESRPGPDDYTDAIAIIGMGCRYPGDVRGPGDLWHLLSTETDAVTEVPAHRWDVGEFFDPDPDAEGKTYTRWGGFVDGVEDFDAGFFGISAGEARMLDPQQRLLLETSWEALEHAGYPADRLDSSRTGVFVGLMSNDYAERMARADVAPDAWFGTGNLASVASGRLSYFLGVHGPSLTIDTACSSSLVTVHTAVRSLRSGECDLALAGGATVVLTPSLDIYFARARGLAADGRCKSFDARADGVVWSDGAGMLVLKRLADAQRDGDRVLGLVRGSAVNSDGRSQGLSAPNGPAQERVIRAALADAAVAAGDIEYVETHGTGTALGDPIEVNALASVLGAGRSEAAPLWIGSVKSNLGHTQAAAGIANIIKVIEAMRHERMPASLHFRSGNPHIDWDSVAVRVVAAERPWRRARRPRRAGVSAFGISGTNAHVVLEEAPYAPEAVSVDDSGPHLLVLSAKNAAALRELAARYRELLVAQPDTALVDLCASAAVCRTHFGERVAIGFETGAQLRAALENVATGRTASGSVAGVPGGADELAGRYVGGAEIDWAAVYSDRPWHQVDLPTYPFQRKRHWLELEPRSGGPGRVTAGQAAPAQPLEHVASAAEPPAPLASSRTLRLTPEMFAGHRLRGVPTVPAAWLCAQLDALAAELPGSWEVTDLRLVTPLEVTAESAVRVVLDRGPDVFDVRFVGSDDAGTSYAHAELTAAQAVSLPSPEVVGAATAPEAWPAYYEILARSGLRLGPDYRCAVEFRRVSDTDAETVFRLPQHPPATLDPILLDACLHSIVVTADPAGELFLPSAIDRVRFFGSPTDEEAIVRCRVRVTERGTRVIVGDAALYSASGRLLASLHGVSLLAARSGASPRAAATDSDSSRLASLLHHVEWVAADSAAPMPDSAAGRWLVFADGPVGDAVADGLAARGADTLIVRPADAAGWESSFITTPSVRGVVFAWTAASVRTRIEAALRLTRDLDAAPHRPAALWLLTVNGQRVTPADRPDPDQALLWGFGRTLATEHPEFGSRLLDLPAEAGSHIAPIVAGLLGEYGTGEFALRDGRWLTARLAEGPVPSDDYRLAAHRSGDFDRMRWEPGARRAPGAGEVEITVAASGLDTRDLWVASGLHPEAGAPLGAECAGRITAVGAGVEGFTVGDRVVALARDSLARHVTVDQGMVAPLPEHLTFADGATVPYAFTTAWHALFDVGGLRAGDRVLVHGSADGVGMAAVRLAAHAGAQVFATAALCRWARNASLTVTRIDTWRLGVSEDVRAATAGQGMDVVLHTLGDDFTAQAAGMLRPGGRLVDVVDPVQRRTAPREGVVDHRELDPAVADPRRLGEILRGVMALFEQQALDALPHAVYGIDRAADAFRAISDRDHPGRVVLLGGDIPTAAGGARSTAGTDLVTGGFGGLGAAAARGRVDRGARQHVLGGRRARDAAGVRLLESLRASGARVTARQADVGDRASVAALLHTIAESGFPPLRGVVHCAGVLDDGVATEQTWSRFETVLRPKYHAARHLDELTRDQPLELFVTYSSVAGVLGTPGQANYAAANAALDALAWRRRAEGLPALSIGWGPFADVGMAADRADVTARLTRRGLPPLYQDDAAAALTHLVRHDSAATGVFGFVPERWYANRSPQAVRRTEPPASVEPRLADDVAPWEALVQRVAMRVLDRARELDPDLPLHDTGVDSLTGMELRAALAAEIGMPLPAGLVFDYPTVRQIARLLHRKGAPAPAGGEAAGETVEDVRPVAEAPTMADLEDVRPAAEAPTMADLPESVAQQSNSPLSGPTGSQRDQPGSDDPIVIVGMSCRFPGGVHTPEDFWDLLWQGRDAITEVPPQRWDIDAYYDPDPAALGRMYTRWGGFVDGADEFDPAFFGIGAAEARAMDPQQRLLLETSWEALERSGRAPGGLAGSRTGVYVGLCFSEYPATPTRAADPASIGAYSVIGSAPSVAAGRLAYVLGLQGPALTLDTACSSSLVALQSAWDGLRAGRCDLALVGGVNLQLAPETTIGFCRLASLSPDGRSRAFDADANGYVRADGCGVLVLTRLSEARRHGDRVLAVVGGVAVNHDGRSNGLTAPNGPAQQRVIADALAQAGLRPEAVDYVEAHGTGTPLGDPIEATALAEVYGAGRTQPLLIGSVKTNIGHTEGAAGVAGVIKAVLMLQHRRIPPSLHFHTPNPLIEWAELPLEVVGRARDWPRTGHPPAIGVSSFGMSGTNAHVIVAQGDPAPASQPESSAAQVLVLSARDESALVDTAERWADELDSARVPLGDLAYTAATARTHFEERLAVVAASGAAAARELRERPPTSIRGRVERTSKAKVALLFTGQGAQYPAMARELHESEPVFRDALRHCDAVLGPIEDGIGLIDAVYGERGPELLRRTVFTQPVLFAVEWALWQLWRSWGIAPAAVLGHSVGEYVAACAAGAMAVEDALRLVAVRGQLMQRLPEGGGMLAVDASAEQVAPLVARYGPVASIAGDNGPAQVVVAGPRTALDSLRQELSARGFRAADLAVSHAFHSAAMDPILDDLTVAAARARMTDPAIPLVSNLTGAPLRAGELSPEYWARHARQPVRFAQGMHAMTELGIETFLEIGPQPTLSALGKRVLGDPARFVASLRRGRGDRETMMTALGHLYVGGVPVDWEQVHRPHGRRRVLAPTYPFQRQRYWVASRSETALAALGDAAGGHSVLSARAAGVLSAHNSLSTGDTGYRPSPGDATTSAPSVFTAWGSNVPTRPDGALVGPGATPAPPTRHGDAPADRSVTSAQLPDRAARPAPAAVSIREAGLGSRPDDTLADLSDGRTDFSMRTGDTSTPTGQADSALTPDPRGSTTYFDVTIAPDSPPYLADHVVDRAVVVPGAWFVATIADTARELLTDDVVAIDDLVITSGLTLTGPQRVRVNFEPSTDGVAVQVTTESAGHHARALVLTGPHRIPDGPSPAQVLARCPETLAGAEFYRLLDRAGLPYGPAFRRVTDVRFGPREALVSLADPGPDGGAGMVHPALLDAAFQATYAAMSPPAGERTWVPFAVDRVLVSAAAGTVRFGHVRVVEQTPQLCVADVRLLDEEGCPVVVANGLRVMPTPNPDGRPSTRAPRDRIAADTYRIEWPETESTQPTGAAGRWLVIGAAGGFTDELADELRARGGDCALARPGRGFAFRAENEFEVDLDAPAAVRALLGAAADARTPLRGIVFAGALSADVAPAPVRAERLVAHALHLVQAAALVGESAVWLLTRYGQRVDPADRVAPEQSALWGFARSAQLEHREIGCHVLDLDQLTEIRTVADALVTPSAPGQLALRQGRRRVPRLVPMETGPGGIAAESAAGHTVLITGGLGGVGLRLARWFADRGLPDLVLAARSAPDARAESVIAELRAAGARVWVRSLDVTDRDAVAATLDWIDRELPPLAGVVHLAGVLDDGVIAEQTAERAGRVLAPKTLGAWNLHELTAARSLRWFLLFSSAAGVVGLPGQSSYGAANAFLDGVAELRGASGSPALSIAWGPWAETGMVERLGSGALERLARRGYGALRPEQALDALTRLIHAEVTGAVATLPLALPEMPAVDLPEVLRDLVAPVPMDASAVSDGSDLPVRMEALVRRCLGLAPEDDLDRPLHELGLDSVAALELRDELSRSSGHRLPATLAFEYPTPRAVVGLLVRLGNAGKPLAPPVTGSSADRMAAPIPAATADAPVASEIASTAPADSFASAAPPLPRTAPGSDYAAPADAVGDIAIVGVSGRYPGADGLDEYWRVLVEGRDCVTEIPPGRWDHTRYFVPDRHNPFTAYTKWGGFLDDVDCFDPLFFAISPREAEILDPQERLFLQTAWAALEDAGHSRADLARGGLRPEQAGVFVGVMWGTYQMFGAEESRLGRGTLPGSTFWSIPNRVSHALDFQGPSMAVDTACSSSLTALHLACQSIRTGECRLAVVGGVNLSLHPYKFVALSQGQFASTDGHCRSFGAGGDGYVASEGVGAMVLRPLADAEADGDTIYGVVKGTAINHGGRVNGFTVPNPDVQARVIRSALRAGGVDPASVSYIEAHGTGTALGDPIEIAGLTKVFGNSGVSELPIGSVKSNVGHLEAAAGVAALTKVLLQLRHRTIVPSLHAAPPNPNIDFAATPFRIPARPLPWPGGDPARPRRATVSSFGAGGANANVVIEEYVDRRPQTRFSGGQVVPVSARDRERLTEYVAALDRFLAGQQPNLADLAYTMQVGRQAGSARAAFVARDIGQLRAVVRAWVDDVPGARSCSDAAEDSRIARWLGGGDVDWATVRDPGPRRRIPAPTYPFARERYWIPDVAPGAGSAQDSGSDPTARSGPGLQSAYGPDIASLPRSTSGQPSGPNPALVQSALDRSSAPSAQSAWGRWADAPRHSSDRSATESGLAQSASAPWSTSASQDTSPGRPASADRRLMVPVWREAPLPSGDLRSRRICVVHDARTPHHVVEALAAAAGDAGRLVRLSDLPGDLNRADFDAGAALGRALVARYPDTDCLLDLCDLVPAAARPTGDLGRIGLYQGVLEARAGSLALVHVTAGHPGSDGPESAPLGGLVAALAEEIRDVRTRSVHVLSERGAVGADSGRLLAILGAECAATEDDCPRVRYRGGIRETVELADAAFRDGLVVDPARAYVVTGGTRGLGAEFAAALVERGARRLAVLGREPLPPEPEWDRVAAGSGPAADKVRRLVELRDRGVAVRTYFGSLTDETALSAFFERVRRELGPIGGVLHCAGSVSGESPAFVRKTGPAVATVLEPKLAGTAVLADVLAADCPDFFVLFSSVSAVLPGLAVGLSDYAMANAHLDRFAEAQHALGRPYFRSVNWPSFRDTGFGEVTSAAYRATGLPALSAAEGFELLDAVLGLPAPVVLPYHDAPLSLSTHARRSTPGEASGPAGPATANGSVAASGSIAANGFAAASGSTAAYAELLRIFSDELKLAPARFEGDKRFEEYGADSVLIASAVRRIEQVIGQPFDPALVLEFPTLDALAGLLTEQFPDRFRSEPPLAGPPTADPRPTSEDAPSTEDRKSRLTTAVWAAEARSGRAAEPIAVIGIGCRLPGGDTPDAFWRLLAAGESGVREVDPARWDPARFYRPGGGPGLSSSKWGGFVDGVDLFDPEYFGVTDELAWQMDPLQRLLLETSVLATIDAGYRRDELAGKRVGVYAGSRAANYFNRIPTADRHTIIGVGQNFIAARISDYFDWHAGNVVLDSACSSSLLSVHLACQALRAGEVDAALAGGVEVLLDEMLFVTLSAAGVLSPHGRCATFSEDADGFVPGEGAALLLLKRLDDALADGDRVYAVLRGSAIGNDGHTMGITTPNMRAQIEVVTAALDMAGMAPDALSYLEAHGTGTMIGDPIELKGLATVLGDRSRGPEPCAVGSVKTNIGHLLSAAGIAGAVKTILAVHHAALPPSLHCDNLNPRFEFAGSPLYVNRELRPWRPADGRPRAAGVSSFGFGGTNAHLVVEQAPDGHRPVRRPLDPPVFRKRSFMLPKTVPSTSTEAAPRIVVPMPQSAPAPSFLRVEPLL